MPNPNPAPPLEIGQATGARAQMLYNLEQTWGNLGTAAWRGLRVIGGETMDQELQVYQSKQIRADRMPNKPIRGSQRPAGNIPFECSPNGWNPFWWHLLGGTPTVTGPTTALAAPAAPTAVPSTTGGVLPAAINYQYEITAVDQYGETLPSTASVAATTTGTTSSIALTWAAVAGAIGYKIYGRATGSFLFMAQVGNNLQWTDTGVITPAGVVPVSNTAGQYYQHVVAGAVSLPTGFTIEKGFTDGDAGALTYYPFFGCRVDKLTLNMDLDKMVDGTWELMSRQAGDPSSTSLNTGAAPTIPTEDPYTFTGCAIYEGSTLALLGTAEKLSLMVNNNFYGTKGFVLGTNIRANLKPGQRQVTLDGTFMFNNANLYEKAIQGTNTAIRLLMTSGPYSLQIDLPTFNFLPNKSTPKITDEGPISISLNGISLPDVASGTNITATIKTAEGAINT